MIETNDCTVKAVMRTFRISYQKAHELMTISGRQFREGHHDFRFWVQNQNPRQFISYQEFPQLSQFLRQYPDGVWIVSIPDHAFCVDNGNVLNDYPLPLSVRVRWAARVDGIQPKEVIDPKRNEFAQNLLAEFKTNMVRNNTK